MLSTYPLGGVKSFDKGRQTTAPPFRRKNSLFKNFFRGGEPDGRKKKRTC